MHKKWHFLEMHWSVNGYGNSLVCVDSVVYGIQLEYLVKGVYRRREYLKLKNCYQVCSKGWIIN